MIRTIFVLMIFKVFRFDCLCALLTLDISFGTLAFVRLQISSCHVEFAQWTWHIPIEADIALVMWQFLGSQFHHALGTLFLALRARLSLVIMQFLGMELLITLGAID